MVTGGAVALPGYQETVHKFSDEALKIVYVEYETPGPSRMPWSAYPDKDGNFWIPYYGRANKIGELNPVSGVIKEFPVPETGTAAIHSAVPAPDGSVWLTEQGTNKLGRWDPKTQKITEFQDDWGKHTARVGAGWSAGGCASGDGAVEPGPAGGVVSSSRGGSARTAVSPLTSAARFCR